MTRPIDIYFTNDHPSAGHIMYKPKDHSRRDRGYAWDQQHEAFIIADLAMLLTKAQPSRKKPVSSSQYGTRETTWH